MEERDFLDEVIELRADEPGMEEAIAEAELRPMEALMATTQEFFARIQVRHPHRTSICGALLAEVMSKDPVSERNLAAFYLGHLGCGRSLGPLERIVPDLVKKIEDDTGPWSGPPERDFLYNILYAFGKIDSERSHALLARLLQGSSSHLVRADVLESMAFEETQFDVELVLPFASDQAHPPEILSALYALEFQDFANERPLEARALAIPLLKHPYPGVRGFAVSMLKTRASNLDLIFPLAEDPYASVREEVTDAIRWSEELSRAGDL